MTIIIYYLHVHVYKALIFTNVNVNRVRFSDWENKIMSRQTQHLLKQWQIFNQKYFGLKSCPAKPRICYTNGDIFNQKYNGLDRIHVAKTNCFSRHPLD